MHSQCITVSPGDRMNKRIAKSPARRISAAQAASLVQSGMWLDYGGALSQPDVFDRVLAARVAELCNVKVRSCLSAKPRAFLEADPEGEHFYSFNWHFGSYDRAKHDAGRCNYIPLNLGEVPAYYRRFVDPVDFVVLKTCPLTKQAISILAQQMSGFARSSSAQRLLVSKGPRVCLLFMATGTACMSAKSTSSSRAIMHWARSCITPPRPRLTIRSAKKSPARSKTGPASRLASGECQTLSAPC